MGRIVTSGIRFGIWWASDPRRVVGTIGVIWLNTLKGPLGNWSRAMTWGITKGAVRAGVAGLIFTARTTWTRLLIPVGIWAAPVAVPVAVGAGVVATAAVIAGVHTGLLQKTGMIGPDAQKASDPNWFGGLEMNPTMFTMGTVV